MQGSEAETLQRYSQSQEELAKIGVPGAREQKIVYEELRRLVSANPYEPNLSFSLTVSSDDWQSSEALRQTFEAAEVAFISRSSKGETIDAMDDFIRKVRKTDYHSFPEVRLLLHTAERWLKALYQIDQHDPLTIETALSLRLGEPEEDLAKSSRVVLPLILKSRELSQVSEIEIHIQTPSEGLKLAGEEAQLEFVPPDLFKKAIPGIALTGKERFRLNIPFTYRGNGTLRIWADYVTPAKGASRTQSKFLEIELAAKTAGPEVKRVSNPYVPDLPLLSESLWKTLAKGANRDLLEQLASDKNLGAGRIFVLRGCRRTGKTSLLRRLQAEMERRGGLLPVYVDIHLWYLELSAKKETINKDELYYEFAIVTLDSTEAPLPAKAGLTDLLAKYRVTMALPVHEFSKFMSAVELAVKRKVLLIIDELDWWVEVFAGSAQSVLDELTTFATKRRAFSAIFSHDLTSPGWDELQKLEKGRLSRRVRFLNRQDVEALTRVVEGVRFSGLAIDLLWRISGGWPGLAQLLCYEVLENLRRIKNSTTIDATVVKMAAETIVQSSRYRELLDYLLGSLTRDEILILRWMATSQRIHLDSSEIPELRLDGDSGYQIDLPESLKAQMERPGNLSDILFELKDKEILEEITTGASTQVRLRVGLLAYPLTYPSEETS